MRRQGRTPPFRTAAGYWDQRGAGKSFDRAIPRSSMTVEQFIADLGELVDTVCARAGQEQVVLHGHSWGSALGAFYASRHPQKVAAYVGTGQITDWPAAESASYAVSALNLLTIAPALQMPVFFFLGRRDQWVPPETSVAYFDALSAPSKELLWFDQSGHEPFVDEPAKFNHAVVDMVRPPVAQ
jgi:pimeloyl-ACP methyl ester carboxylesterase